MIASIIARWKMLCRRFIGFLKGWLGRYADLALSGHGDLPLVSSTFVSPKSISANKVVPVNLTSFSVPNYAFQTDPQFTASRAAQIALLKTNNGRSFPEG